MWRREERGALAGREAGRERDECSGQRDMAFAKAGGDVELAPSSKWGRVSQGFNQGRDRIRLAF